MKKYLWFFLLIAALSFACAGTAPSVTSTPVPSNTPLPTNTLPPTNTPLPQVPGVNIPMKYAGVGFTVSKVETAGSWVINGETNYPTNPGDVIVVVTFAIDGNLFSLPAPVINEEDPSRTYHLLDSYGAVDHWSYYKANETGTVFTMIFAGDGSARSFYFVFPNGQKIDLTPFLS